MPVGLLDIYVYLPGCKSLKEKRGRILPIIHQLQRKYNVSVAEIDQQDIWQSTHLSCAIVSNEKKHIEKCFNNMLKFIESHWPDESIRKTAIEFY